MPCGAPCGRLPCNIRCDRLLKCGHQCPSICGEFCPDESFCQECCTRDLKETAVEYLEMTNYKDIDLDIDPIIVLPCNHFFCRSSLDRALELDKVYISDENDQFIECIPNSNMASQLEHARCPLCRSTVSNVPRYNRVTKRVVLDCLLMNLISRSQKQYQGLAASVEEFKRELDADRDEALRKLQPLRNPTQSRPLSAKNGAVFVERMKKFDPLKQKIDGYLKKVDESQQPHMKVYQMSIAAHSRRNLEMDNLTSPAWALDVPSPDIKHRLLGNILAARLQVWQNAEMLQFLGRQSSIGFKSDAVPFYDKVIKDCTSLQAKLSKHKAECDSRMYHSLAVEMIIIQAELMALATRASQFVGRPKALGHRDRGVELLDSCEAYFQKYPSCRCYESSVERAREGLRVLHTFYDSVSPEERRAIYQGMQGTLGSSGRWYYCRNGHPVYIRPDNRLTKVYRRRMRQAHGRNCVS